MKRLIYIAFLTLLFSSCQVPPVPQDHLSILSGVSNNQLTFDGNEGSRATFSLSSKLAWEILDTPGVTYSPSKGEATERVTITATIHSSNRSLKIREVGDVIIRLNRTRFTGITAVQRPLITLEQEQVTLSAVQSEYSTFTYTSKESDIEVVAEGDIVCSQPQSIGSDKYSVQVAPTKDNLSIEENTAGNITFKVAGDALSDKLQAIQRPALSFDRSRITVGGNSGEQASVSVNSTFDFTVTATTSAIEVAKGESGMVDITVVEPNTTSQERKLGAITVTLVDNPSCNISIDVWQRTALAERTMMFYYLGMSLKSFYDANLATVEKCVESGSLGDTRVLAFIQSSQNSGSLYEIFYDKGLGKIVRDPIATYDLPQLYSEQMLSEIFCDMTVRAPAKEYGLFIGSHGKGWIPKNSASLGSSSTYSTFSAEHLESIWTPAPGAIMVRHIGDTTSTQVDTTEIAGALKSTGCHLSYIIFDACYMANVESAYDLKEVTDYILGSACEIIANGMPYGDILPIMASTSPLLDRLNNSAKAFVDYYKNNRQGAYSSACSAVIDCRQLDALAEVTKRVNGSLQRIDPNSVQSYDGINLTRNPTHIFFDIEDYVIKSCTDADAVAAFSAQLYRTVTGLHHTKTFYSAYNNKANEINYYSGLTTSAPIMLHAMSAYVPEWKECAWYLATH
ncbi:MAG: hypothetical protein IJB23_01365 [Alistipes sp.]|nr:hypothetical protein [Alistipes sp.]